MVKSNPHQVLVAGPGMKLVLSECNYGYYYDCTEYEEGI